MTPHDQHTSAEELTAAWTTYIARRIPLMGEQRAFEQGFLAARRTVERQGEGLEWNDITLAEVIAAPEPGALESFNAIARRRLTAARHPTPNSADGAENGREG